MCRSNHVTIPPPRPALAACSTDIHDDPDAARFALLADSCLHRSNDSSHLGHRRHDSPSTRFPTKRGLGSANACEGSALARLRRGDLMGQGRTLIIGGG